MTKSVQHDGVSGGLEKNNYGYMKPTSISLASPLHNRASGGTVSRLCPGQSVKGVSSEHYYDLKLCLLWLGQGY